MKLALVLIVSLWCSVESSSNGCCKYKSVGQLAYGFVGTENTSAFKCKNDCVYTRYGDKNSRVCFAKGINAATCFIEEGQCFHDAFIIGTNECSADCETGPESSCEACLKPKISLKCFFGDLGALTCVYHVPKCNFECRLKHPINQFKFFECVNECIPSKCKKVLCSILSKISPALNAICSCLIEGDLLGIITDCVKENPKISVVTLECIVAKVPLNCASALCTIVADAIEEPELQPVCACGAAIIIELDKCYLEHKPNYEEIAKCTIEAATQACRQYVCQFAGRKYPEILPVCTVIGR